jgi:hypothetical protein
MNIWRVIKGSDLYPLPFGIKKMITLPTTLSKNSYDNYLTLSTFEDGFGVAQNVFTNEKQLIIHSNYSPYLGDLYLGTLIVLSGYIIPITVDGDIKMFPICLGLN